MRIGTFLFSALLLFAGALFAKDNFIYDATSSLPLPPGKASEAIEKRLSNLEHQSAKIDALAGDVERLKNVAGVKESSAHLSRLEQRVANLEKSLKRIKSEVADAVPQVRTVVHGDGKEQAALVTSLENRIDNKIAFLADKQELSSQSDRITTLEEKMEGFIRNVQREIRDGRILTGGGVLAGKQGELFVIACGVLFLLVFIVILVQLGRMKTLEKKMNALAGAYQSSTRNMEDKK